METRTVNITYADGFYEPENDGLRDFRWMRTIAHIQIATHDANKALVFSVGNPHGIAVQLVVAALKKHVLIIEPGWHTVLVPLCLLSPNAVEKISLACDYRLQVNGDKRELSLMLGDILLQEYSFNEGSFTTGSGFYEGEHDGIRGFHWITQKASLLAYPGKDQWLLFEVGFPGTFPVRLKVTRQNVTTEFFVINGWQQLAVDFPHYGESCLVTFETDARYEVPGGGDTRKLALMLGNIHCAPISNYERNSYFLHTDLFRNVETMARPTFFTFETSAICNMKCNMCVVDSKLKHYDISRVKTSEKTNYIFDELLPYATKLQLHATGEVLTGKDFWKALDKVKRTNKQTNRNRSLEIEIFTNGQLLNQENIDRLVDSPLTDCVVSMDAATEKTYARIRGGDFGRLCNNVRNLIRTNKERGKKLRIALGMVLMRENVEELPQFVELAHRLGAETVTFWPLFAVWMDMPPKTAKDGFIFNYKQQMLINYPNITRQKIEEAFRQAVELNVRIGVTPCFSKDYRQFNYEDLPYPLSYKDFCSLAESKERKRHTKNQEDIDSLKGCYLPWNTAFITTEGRFAPCLLMTYLGGIDTIIGKDFFKDVWNGNIMQELRKSVIEGKPHQLCKNAQCIFVNKLY